MSKEIFINEITETVKGLNYISETDSTVTVFQAGRPVEVLNIGTFLHAIRKDMATAEQSNFDNFFDALLDRDADHATQWNALRELLAANLTETTVFKVAVNPTNFDIYIVGLYEGGFILGTLMHSVET